MSKLQIITELAADTAREIARGSPYMAFLKTAANNFKYSFRDQLLIHAQKPDAAACAEISFWNRRGRWVKRGTKGIALLVDAAASYKLRYVFDQSDTERGPEIPVWRMESQYESSVMEELENAFGLTLDRSDFPSALMETAKLLTEDNISDYYADLHEAKAGSLLEELDETSAQVWFRDLVQNSVAFMLLSRCGIDAGEYFTAEDFAHVYEFNSQETISVLGAAASEIGRAHV